MAECIEREAAIDADAALRSLPDDVRNERRRKVERLKERLDNG